MSEECSYLLAAGSGIAHILLIRNSVKCMKILLAFKAQQQSYKNYDVN